MDVLTLPCGRGRHGSCAGQVHVGIAVHQRQHECICTCHWAADLIAATTPRPRPMILKIVDGVEAV